MYKLLSVRPGIRGKKRELYKREKGGRMIVVNDFLPPLFIQF